MRPSRPVDDAENAGPGRRQVLAYATALPLCALMPSMPALAAPAPGARAIAGRWDVYDLPVAADLPEAARALAASAAPPDGPPRAEARAPDGRIWFTDWDAARIGCRAPGGTVTRWEMPLGLRSGPSAIALDGAGTIHVGEFIANRVARFDPAAGRFTGAWELPLPRTRLRRLAIDDAGCLWCAGERQRMLFRLS